MSPSSSQYWDPVGLEPVQVSEFMCAPILLSLNDSGGRLELRETESQDAHSAHPSIFLQDSIDPVQERQGQEGPV